MARRDSLRRDERGTALTEYLVLVGLVVGALALAPGLGDAIGGAFAALADWVGAQPVA